MTIFGAFQRPVGAAADVRELEYLSALHQTSKVLWSDGTISAHDVLLFLRSRYGLVVSPEDAIDIVKGLSGTARLPLPLVENKEWTLVSSSEPETIPEDVEVGTTRKRKRCCKHKEDDEKEDELAHIKDQWKSMIQGDVRKGWEFPALQRQIRREVPDEVEKLVRFDLVQMMSMLLIPTLVRLQRRRFESPNDPPDPPPSPPGHVNDENVWNLAKLGGNIFKIPVLHVKQRCQERIVNEKASLQPKPETLLLDVLCILLSSLEEREAGHSLTADDFAQYSTGTTTVQGKSHFPELERTVVTKELIQQMMETCQFDEATIKDDALLENMMELVGGEGAILDERAFAKALTSDVNCWPVESEDNITTTFYDVYGFSNTECNKYAEMLEPNDSLSPPTPGRDEDWTPAVVKREVVSSEELSMDSSHQAAHDEEQRSENDGTNSLRLGKIPEFKPTMCYIDYASDAFRSVFFVMYLFCFYLAASAFVVILIFYMGIDDIQCEPSFGCQLIETIWAWLILAIVLIIAGVCITLPVSLINHPDLKSKPQALISIVLLVAYLIFPLIEWLVVDVVGVQVNEQYFFERASEPYTIMLMIYLVFGFLTLIMALRAVVGMHLPKPLVRRYALLRLMYMPSDIRRTAMIKKAGTHKMNAFIKHAHAIHRKAHKKARGRNAEHETMLNFLLHGEKEEKCGGLLWTWFRWSHKLGRQEGVWLHSRFATGQMGQILVASAFIVLWVLGTKYAAEGAQKNRDSVEDDGSIGSEWALFFIPESWMIYWSFYPGGSVALVLIVTLILIPYPNTVSTVLKFRSGVLPSLHSESFPKYRKNSALIYYNVGNMIYALTGASVFLFVIFAGALYLFMWEPSRAFMMRLLAWGVGLAITVFLKKLLLTFCGAVYWKANYRKRPAAANVTALAYECWHIGLGGGVMLARLGQFLLAAAFWIGRIDSPFLSEEVQVFGYRFDTVNEKYTSEILVHEAHRHPFMERLMAMYLMRLKHGEHFGSDAGAAWRNIFVLTLMPWLLKYSQGQEDDDEDDEDGEDFPLGSDVSDATAKVAFSGNVPWNDDRFASNLEVEPDSNDELANDETSNGDDAFVSNSVAENGSIERLAEEEKCPSDEESASNLLVVEIDPNERVAEDRGSSANEELASNLVAEDELKEQVADEGKRPLNLVSQVGSSERLVEEGQSSNHEENQVTGG